MTMRRLSFAVPGLLAAALIAGCSSGATGTPDGGATGIPEGGSNAAIYVAPNGRDVNPGTLQQPVRPLARARDIVRTRNAAMTAEITVYLRGGTYPLTDTVPFSNADSGSDGFYVKYVAYPGERPVLTGGQPIAGWKVFDASKN